MVELNL